MRDVRIRMVVDSFVADSVNFNVLSPIHKSVSQSTLCLAEVLTFFWDDTNGLIGAIYYTKTSQILNFKR